MNGEKQIDRILFRYGRYPQMTGAEWGWVIIGALLIGSFTLATT